MRIILALIVSVSILIMATLLWLLIPFLNSGSGPLSISGSESLGGSAVDSGARIDIELMRGEIESLQGQVDALEAQVSSLAIDVRREREPLLESQSEELPNFGPNSIIDSYAQVVLVAGRRGINKGLFVANSRYLVEKLGLPRENLGNTCEPMTNERLRSKLVVEDVGPIRVQMLKPAVDSLRRVFEKIRATDKDLYDRINTAGSLCVRLIRGSSSSVSTHAFGLAVDLNIDGHLDTLGDGKTQLGLTILADFFNAEGWAWGASFSREDSMHFEVSQKLIDTWLANGDL